MVEPLEYYNIHISQHSPLGMLQYLRMMLRNKSGAWTKLVLKENNPVVAFWRTFRSDFEGNIKVVACSEGEEGWYETTVGNFRLPDQAALKTPLPQGKGLGDVNRRLGEAEARVRQVDEERDGLATSNAQLVDDRAWMQQFGVIHIVNVILETPENTTAVANVNERAREAGFKAGYN
ncbi:hypothetical protein Hanom_Chr03g00206191 [Helianthus anomalus]